MGYSFRKYCHFVAPSCKVELARFSVLLRIQDGAECGNTYRGRGHRTYFLDGGGHRTFLIDWGTIMVGTPHKKGEGKFFGRGDILQPPGDHYEFCRQCGIGGAEEVPPSPLWLY